MTFIAAESLFKKVNRELDQAIKDIPNSKNIPEAFNESLSNIIYIEVTAAETFTSEITGDVA